MNIAVYMKQVPDATEIKIDPVKNTLIRTGVPSITNPLDKNALKTGLQLKDRYGEKVTVISTGPSQVKAALREALAMGVDEAYLVTDRALGDFDTHATSYILSQAIKRLGGFDVILGGKQAIGGDTGQTALSIVEHLRAVRLTYVLNMEVRGGKMVARRQVGRGVEVIEASLPVLCTATEESNKSRYATIKGALSSLKAEIREIILASLSNSNTTKMGLKGSPTKVKATFTPKRNANYMNIGNNSPAETAGALTSRLTKARILQGWQEEVARDEF